MGALTAAVIIRTRHNQVPPAPALLESLDPMKQAGEVGWANMKEGGSGDGWSSRCRQVQLTDTSAVNGCTPKGRKDLFQSAAHPVV